MPTPEGPSLCQRWLWCLCSLVTCRCLVSMSPFLEPHTPHLAVRNALEASTASCISVCISGATDTVLNVHLSCTSTTIGDLAPEPTWLVHQPSHKYWQPEGHSTVLNTNTRNTFKTWWSSPFWILLWILPAIQPQKMGKQLKENFQLDQLNIASSKFERLENSLLFAGGDYLKIPRWITFGWPPQWTWPRHPCRVHGAFGQFLDNFCVAPQPNETKPHLT